FAVGFALRLMFVRRRETLGTWGAYRRALVRVAGLLLLGLMVHGLDGGALSWEELRELGVGGFLLTGLQRKPFQTLVHIAVTSLWVLPVLAALPAIRVAYAAGSAVLFWYLSQRFYYTWVMTRPGIDGGPLGFLTWTIPVLVGSLAYDAIMSGSPKMVIGRLLFWGVVLMALGYGLSCLSQTLNSEGISFFADPPFVAPANSREMRDQLSRQPQNAGHLLWVMSQRAGSPSYLVFGAGFSLALYALFVLVCDVVGFKLAVL